MHGPNKITFAFFGGEPLGVPTLDALEAAGLLPSLVVCNPDRPVGRKQVLTAPPVKQWATERNIPTLQPTSYDADVHAKLTATEWDVFVVVAYNHILPAWLLNIPRHGVLNVHPSLLPRLRGASPIRSAILRNEPDAVGVTIMQMDAQMDHGPIITQEAFPVETAAWPPSGPKLDDLLAKHGGDLLARTLPAWVAGDMAATPQNHAEATYCGKFKKTDSELAIDPHQLPTGEAAATAWRTINAFAGIGDTFFVHDGKRIKIKQAELTPTGELRLLRVIPEGKQEMDFVDYRQQIS